jgi:hypothetical protein
MLRSHAVTAELSPSPSLLTDPMTLLTHEDEEEEEGEKKSRRILPQPQECK